MQSAHAAINFCFEHPSRAGPWFTNSNYLALLEAENEQALYKIVRKCDKAGLYYTEFREPDIGNRLTALAIEPAPGTKRITAHLPLLFKNRSYETAENSPQIDGYQSPSIQPDQDSPLQKAS